MRIRYRGDGGFRLVELMTVALVIGILVAILIPIYEQQATQVRARSCEATQRTILGAIQMARTLEVSFATASAGQLIAGSFGWSGSLIPDRLKSKPICRVGDENYYMSEAGDIRRDSSLVQAFKSNHELP